MADNFIGEIRGFAFNFPPKGWALCNGALLPIQNNTALFSLLGTMYGGDGRSTFALPDLMGRCAIHRGQGPGLPDYVQGQTGGAVSVVLAPIEMPVHNHPLEVTVTPGTTTSPVGRIPSAATPSPLGNSYGSAANHLMRPGTVHTAGAGGSHENRMPQLVMQYCIALTGVYPARS